MEHILIWALLATGVLQVALSAAALVAARWVKWGSLAGHRLFTRWILPLTMLVSGMVYLGLAVAWPGSALGTAPEPGTPGEPLRVLYETERDATDGEDRFIGVVQDGEFWILSPAPPAGGMARLTTIGMQEAVAPESGEIDLTPYEGSALMVHGQDGGGWIYLAEVIDQGGPILTEVVKQVFRQGKRAAHLA